MSFQPICPPRSQFYTCPNGTNQFVGCCNTPACNDGADGIGGTNGCPDKDLEPARFTEYPGDDVTPGCHQGSSWYTCPDLLPLSFMGCCKRHPCSQGCPKEDLTQAFLTYGPKLTDKSGTLIPTSTNEASNSSTTSSVSPSSINTSFDTSNPAHSSVLTANVAGQSALHTETPAPKTTNPAAQKSNATAIAGGVAGGIVGLALLVGLLAICCRRRNTRKLDEGRSLAWGSGPPYSTQLDNAELEVMKQGASLTSSPLRPPSPQLSPLPSPLPPPPAYTAYRPQGSELDRSPNHCHRPSGSPYVSSDLPSPELPPSPPPLENRISQRSTDSYSDGQSVSPISSHYQHQPFDTSRSLESSAYTEVSREPLHIHGMRS